MMPGSLLTACLVNRLRGRGFVLRGSRFRSRMREGMTQPQWTGHTGAGDHACGGGLLGQDSRAGRRWISLRQRDGHSPAKQAVKMAMSIWTLYEAGGRRLSHTVVRWGRWVHPFFGPYLGPYLADFLPDSEMIYVAHAFAV